MHQVTKACKGAKAVESSSLPSTIQGTQVEKIWRIKTTSGEVVFATIPVRSAKSQDQRWAHFTAGTGTTLEIISSPFKRDPSRRSGRTVCVEKILSPVVPPNIFCVGLNYLKHWKEGARQRGQPKPLEPAIFMKPTTSLVGPDAVIRLPSMCLNDEAVSRIHAEAKAKGWLTDKCEALVDESKAAAITNVDYEAEMVIVIGHRPVCNATEANALDFVLGFTAGNDVSQRFWQLRNAKQWGFGKGFDSFCPIGPAIVTVQSMVKAGRLNQRSGVLKLGIKTKLRQRQDGDRSVLMQDANTDDLIFTVAQIVKHISTNRTLLPGTVILTGTPCGVGKYRSPPAWLTHGSIVEVEVDTIGILRNTVQGVTNSTQTTTK